MFEVTSVSASSYDPESLVPMLNEKVGEGWEIVSIVSAGTKVIAYLQREGGGSTGAAPAAEEAAVEAAPAVDEPAGWGVAPADESDAAETAAVAAAATAGVTAPTTPEPAPAAQPPAQQVPAQEPQQQAAAQPESTVPAGWYADPSSRYELRYWDGNGWTEHVSRAGQQYTDPPVA